MGVIAYLITSTLLLRKIMPHYGIFVMMGVGALSYLTTSFLPLREILPDYGIFCHDWGGGIKLSDHFYSAPSQNCAPLWYIGQEW